MIFGSNSFLGLSVSDRAITCAEVESRAGKVIVRRTATLEITPGADFDTPDALGTALARVLRESGIESRRVVVGVPAKWLIATAREVPPANLETAHSVLRLAAERLSVSDAGDAVFDYSGEPSTSKSSNVLLVGILRRQLDRVQKMAASAELDVQSVMPSSLAVVAAAGAKAGASAQGQPVVLMGRNSVELVWPGEGGARMLKHLQAVVSNGHDIPFLKSLGPELRRNAAMAGGGLPASGAMPTGGRQAMLWDGVGLSSEQVADLSATSGLALQNGGGAAALGLDVAVAAAGSPVPVDSGNAYIPAMALGLVGVRPELSGMNFLDSRLAPPVPKRISKQMKYAIAAGALAVILLGWLIVDVQNKTSYRDQLKAESSKVAPDVKLARTFTDRVDYADGFFDDRTPVLDCLAAITKCFDDNERMWVSSVTLRENGKGKIDGKSLGRNQGDAQSVVRSLDGRLRDSVNLMGVSMLDTRSSSAKTQDEYTFSFSFQFLPTVQKAPAKIVPANAVPASGQR